MIHETVSRLYDEVQRAVTALRISQNEVARRAGVHPSILSRVLRGLVTSGPAVEKLTAWLASVRRAVVVAERKAKAS